MLHDQCPTKSTIEQDQVEQSVRRIYAALYTHLRRTGDISDSIVLSRDRHAGFLLRAFGELPGMFSSTLSTK